MTAMRWGAVAIGFAAALYPLATWYVDRLSDGNDEPLGLVALAAAVLIAWARRRECAATPLDRWLSVGLLALYGSLAWLAFPPLVRALPAIGAVLFWFGVWRNPAIVALSLLSLPVIASLQFYIGYPLRLLAAQSTELLLGLAHVPVAREGVQIVFKGTTVGFDPPCSGVRMLWAGGFLAALIGGRFRIGWGGMLLLALAASGAAIATNIARATFLFFPESGILPMPDWGHEAVGFGCFALAACMLVHVAGRIQIRSTR